MGAAERPRGPLHGVRVLECSLIFSAPFAGLHLADLGADVVKVEPPGGEPFRHLAAVVPGHSKVFQSVNRGKRSLALDLRRPEAREVVRRLLPGFDAVLINFRPGIAARLGLGYDALRAIRPDLIYAEIGGFDPGGPYEDRAASDMVAQAYGGSIALDAKVDEDGAPVWPAMVMGDFPAGMAAAMGLIAALYHRERTGEGQRLSVSLLRAVLAMNCYQVNVEPVSDAYGRDPILAELRRTREAGGSYRELVAAREAPLRRGSPMAVYWRGYQAADGGLVFGALTKANRDAIRGVLGIDDDPTDGEGYDQHDPANAELAERLRARVARILRGRTVGEWLERFEAAGAPVAPVLFPEELPDHEEGSRHFVGLEHELTGPQRFVGPIVQLERTPSEVPGPSPLPGADGGEVLAAIGGYAPEEIAALRGAGVLG